MKLTFREFIEGVKTQVEKVIAGFLGVDSFEAVKPVGPELEDDVLMRGKLVDRAVVRSAAKNGNIQPGLGQRRGNAH
jgi:hypothetical protein